MEGIPGIQNFDYSRFYGAGMDLSNMSEEQIAQLMQEQKMKWIKSSALAPQAQPGAQAAGKDGAVDGTTGASPGAGQNANAAAGEPIINKNGTKMNAQEVATISDIFKKAGKSGMKAEELAEKLKERGIEATATKINGKMALKFANGDTFVDTSANGVLDTDDKEWTEALKTLKSKYGDNPPQLQGGQGNNAVNTVNEVNNTENGQAINNNAAADTPQQANPAAVSPQLLNPTGEGKNQDAQQLKTVLSDLDRTLAEKGYQGIKSEELCENGQLESVLAQYGVQMPAELEQYGAGSYVNNLFRNALMIAGVS